MESCHIYLIINYLNNDESKCKPKTEEKKKQKKRQKVKNNKQNKKQQHEKRNLLNLFYCYFIILLPWQMIIQNERCCNMIHVHVLQPAFCRVYTIHIQHTQLHHSFLTHYLEHTKHGLTWKGNASTTDKK